MPPVFLEKISGRNNSNLKKSKSVRHLLPSPLGATGGQLLKDPVLKKIASKHRKSIAQLVLRWDLQRDMVTIPKSIHQARIIANTDIYDFELSSDEMKTINDLDGNPQRSGPNPDIIGF